MKAKALYANTADTEEELTFKPGDVLTVHEQDVAGLVGWWLCSMGDRTGIAPGNRLRILSETDSSSCRAVSSTPSPVAVTSQAGSRPFVGDKSNKLVIPHKSGNLYIYDSPKQETDYDIPSTGQQLTAMTSFTDYDVPHCNASADYDIPVVHRGDRADRPDPASSLSNRSSMVSVQSTGSQSSVTSGRERHLVTSPESAVSCCSRSLRDSVLDDYDVPRCDFLSDGSTSADSGVYCGFQGPKVDFKPQAVRCLLKDEPDENHDYDIPETYTTGNHQAEVERERVVGNNTDDSGVLVGLRDSAIKNVERLVHWLNSEQTNHWSIQVKLAGLALKTALQELLAVYDTSSQNYKPRESLGEALVELTRCLDCFTASSPSTHAYGTSPGNRSQQHRLMTSHCSTNTFDAIQRLTASLPSLIKQFVDDVIGGNTSPRAVESVTSPSYNSPPHSAMTSSRSTFCRNKPPPVKPKPPKQLITSLKRQNNASPHNKNTSSVDKVDEDGLSDDCDYAAIASEAERQLGTSTPHQRRSTVQKGSPASLPPRPPVSAKPPIAKKPEVVNSSAGTRPQLNDADRELIEFYATQIAAHTSIVEQAARDFYQCTSAASSSTVTSLSADVFVRRSRFVVLAGHKLVYLGDSLARHVNDEIIRDRVAMAANELCNQLKTVVMATKQTALASASEVDNCERRMVESVSRATDGCKCLTSLIRDISQW